MAADISSKEIEDFKAAFAEGRTVATVNHYLKFLKAVFNRAVRQGRFTYNPVTAVKLYRENNARNRCLSPEEEVRLLKVLPDRLRPLVTVALNTGMRRGELRNLRWEDVDFATGTIHVRQNKAGDGRWVVMNSAAREALLSVKREQKILSPYVFCSPQGKFLHNFERDWRPALQEAKIPDFRFHDCHLCLSPGNGGRRSVHRPASGRLEDSGHGSAVCTPKPRPHAGSGGAAGSGRFRGRNRH